MFHSRFVLTSLFLNMWAATAIAQLTGELGAHDPSTIFFDAGRYYYFSTGDLLASRSSSNLTSWTNEGRVFDAVPSWISTAVPDYSGNSLWAPDVIKLGSQYYLYYSASVWGTKRSAIGYATSPTLDPDAPNYGWTDHGLVIGSNNSSPYNAIDPSLLLDNNTGRLWMTWGSFNNGIYVKELNPNNGQPLDSSPGTNVAAPGPTPEIEGAAMVQRDGYYYMFVNWGGCCSGSSSTYNIRVGRSTSPTGPYLDRNGVNMLNGGGTLFLDDDGRKIGPGHFSFVNVNGQDKFSYHYYDADLPWAGGQTGFATFGLRDLYWTSDAWPSFAAVNPNWTGSVDNSWDQSANWTYGTVPNGTGHVANFAAQSSGPHSVTLPSNRTVGTINFRGFGSYTIGATSGPTLALDSTAGELATLNVAEGSHSIAAPISSADNVGVNVTPTASTLTLSGTVSGPRLTKYGDGRLTLSGTNSIAGSIFVKRGTLTITGAVTAGSYTSVGQILGETGTMSVEGSGSFTENFDLNIGDTGDNTTPATGILYLKDQASIVVNTGGGFYVGSGNFSTTRAEGTVHQSGGTLTVNRPQNGSFIIGGRISPNANGTYNLSGGSVAANTNVFVGGFGRGTVNQSGGVFNASQSLSIGRFTGSSGNWTISGGTFNQTNGGTSLLVGDQGAGSLTVAGTGQVNATGTVRIGNSASGAGTVNLNGGTLVAPAVVRGSGTATVNFNGGVLRAVASHGAFLQGLTNARVNAGGAMIDSQTHNITIAQPLLHDPMLGATRDGGLTKLGTGVLTLTANSTYTGDTHIDNGTLALLGAGAISHSKTIYVNEGASLDVSGKDSFTLANGQALINNSNHSVLGNVVAGSGSAISGTGRFANSVVAQSGATVRVGTLGPPVASNLAISNGDFESGIPNNVHQSNVAAPWYDFNGASFFNNAWQLSIDSVSYNDTPMLALSAFAANTTVDGAGLNGYAYQNIGVDPLATTLAVSFDMGSFEDTTDLRDLGLTVSILESDGSFTPADNADILNAAGVRLIDQISLLELDVAPGNSFSKQLKFDLSSQTGGTLFIRFNNYETTAGEANPNDEAWIGIDNVTLLATRPGSESAGDNLVVDGDLTIESGAEVTFNIAEPGMNDALDVAGNLSLTNGFKLHVELDGSVPVASLADGDSWDLFDFTTSNGDYDGDTSGFILPSGLASGLEWDASRLLVDGTLSVSRAGLLGDYNDNGVIDAADYTVWRDNLGGTIPNDPTGGVATQDDYNYWKTHFGETLGSGPGGGSSIPAVPEPAPAILLLIVAPVLSCGALGRRRR